jgi:hypothetical protein
MDEVLLNTQAFLFLFWTKRQLDLLFIAIRRGYKMYKGTEKENWSENEMGKRRGAKLSSFLPHVPSDESCR